MNNSRIIWHIPPGTLKNSLEIFAAKFEQKARLKEKELELRKEELELQKRKWELEEEERKHRMKLESDERRAFIELILKKQ